MRVDVLGPTVVVHEDLRLGGADLGGGKPRQLLEMLALSRGTPVPKDVLAEQLWDGRPPCSYLATVESYVCGLRRRIGLPGGRRGPLATTSHGYVLDPEQVDVDLWEVNELLQDDEGDAGRLLHLLDGELLAEEPYAAWANAARVGFADVVAATCVRYAQVALRRGDPALAVRLARQADRHSYLSEPALRVLMEGLVQTGDRVQALQAYESLRVAMRDELGMEPEPATQQHYLAILRGPRREPGRGGRDEIGALLQLLRRALEEDPAHLIALPAMVEVGQLLLARSG